MTEDVKKNAGSKKPQLVLMPPIAEEQCCGVLALGAAKYGEWNWRASGVEAGTYISAIKRHLAAVHRGEWVDPESGLPHLAHVMASAALVLDADSVGLCKREVAQSVGKREDVPTVHKGVGEGDEGLDITKCIGREAVISLLNHGIDPYKPNP